MAVNEESFLKTIELASLAISESDKINKRVITAIIIESIAVCVTAIVIAGFYFFQN